MKTAVPTNANFYGLSTSPQKVISSITWQKLFLSTSQIVKSFQEGWGFLQ